VSSPGTTGSEQAANEVTSRPNCSPLGLFRQLVGMAAMPVLSSVVRPTKLARPPGVVAMSPGRLGSRRNEKPGTDSSRSTTSACQLSIKATSSVAGWVINV
jgi:hypothetical protein